MDGFWEVPPLPHYQQWLFLFWLDIKFVLMLRTPISSCLEWCLNDRTVWRRRKQGKSHSNIWILRNKETVLFLSPLLSPRLRWWHTIRSKSLFQCKVRMVLGPWHPLCLPLSCPSPTSHRWCLFIWDRKKKMWVLQTALEWVGLWSKCLK